MPFNPPIQCLGNNPDISDWPETATITSIEFRANDFIVHHSKEDGPGRWPDVHIPGWGNGADDPGNIQWTLWAVIPADGGWRTCGCLEFWHGHNNVNGPYSNAAKDWYYMVGGMAGRQPGPGERVGFIVTSGDHRGKDITLAVDGVTNTRERSSVAWVTVPQGEQGFVFPLPSAPVEPPAPPPVDPQQPPPPPPPPPAPVADPRIDELVKQVAAQTDAIKDLTRVAQALAVAGAAVAARVISFPDYVGNGLNLQPVKRKK